MKIHLKYAFRSLALLTCLSLTSTLQAQESTAQTVAQQPQVEYPAVIGSLAWQRVGAPITLDA